jgi:hypothetical protein
MKTLAVIPALVLLVLASPVFAQKPTNVRSADITVSPGELKATPEMWFYEQEMRRHDDPKAAVRERAEFRADQRQNRLETMKWYGFSNARPRVCADYINGDGGPRWTSRSLYYPDRWTSVNQLFMPY